MGYTTIHACMYKVKCDFFCPTQACSIGLCLSVGLTSLSSTLETNVYVFDQKDEVGGIVRAMS